MHQDHGFDKYKFLKSNQILKNFEKNVKTCNHIITKKYAQNKNTPKTHMMTCLINSDTGELLQKLKNYLNGLLIKNHIGDNKEKIKKYAKAHVCQVVSITKKHSSSIYRQLCGKICIDTLSYWKDIGITDPEGWAEKCLIELLIGISELRYSDFCEDEDNQIEN